MAFPHGVFDIFSLYGSGVFIGLPCGQQFYYYYYCCTITVVLLSVAFVHVAAITVMLSSY